jgi:hypothetical protein
MQHQSTNVNTAPRQNKFILMASKGRKSNSSFEVAVAASMALKKQE